MYITPPSQCIQIFMEKLRCFTKLENSGTAEGLISTSQKLKILWLLKREYYSCNFILTDHLIANHKFQVLILHLFKPKQ
jgi:hypothetical protein